MVWAGVADLFHHPVFRAPSAAEITFARRFGAEDGYRIFTWDAETSHGDAPMMVVARDARVSEGLFPHTADRPEGSRVAGPEGSRGDGS
ncbi:MAG TPA: hypothetical protein VN408_30750 [Actinoplanes sp.]|nr:hypothetical protein [Actinoplanes sp.]